MLNFDNEISEQMAFRERKLSAITMLISYIGISIMMLFIPGISQPGGWIGFALVLVIFGIILFVPTKYPIDEIFINTFVAFIVTKGFLSFFYNTMETTKINPSDLSDTDDVKLPFISVFILMQIIANVFGYVVFYKNFRNVKRSDEAMPYEREFFGKSGKFSWIGTLVVTTVVSLFVGGGYESNGEIFGKVFVLLLFFIAYVIVRGTLNGSMAKTIGEKMTERKEMKQNARREARQRKMRDRFKR